MTHDQYVKALADLLSRDPERLRAANRVLYATAVGSTGVAGDADRQADLALAEAAQP